MFRCSQLHLGPFMKPPEFLFIASYVKQSNKMTNGARDDMNSHKEITTKMCLV